MKHTLKKEGGGMGNPIVMVSSEKELEEILEESSKE